jgi:hypothetical protein
MHRAFAFAVLALALTLTLALLGCSSAPTETTDDTSESALTGADIISRAEQWVAVKMPYCQVPNHVKDIDPFCASVCTRPDNATWNPYRSDCSGFVSYTWGLPAPGRVTKQFAPFVNDISHTIPATELQPGDAINNDEHMFLFKGWTIPNQQAIFIEEPGCSGSIKYAHEFTSNVSINGDSLFVAYQGKNFYAVRYNKVGPSAPQLPVFPPGYVITGTKTDGGYWQLGIDGAIYSFGDAQYHGGANGIPHSPTFAMSRTSTGNGYWLLGLDGAIYSFGDAGYHGGLNSIPHPTPAIGMATSGSGYWIVAQDGAIYSFGGAQYHGGANGFAHAPIIGIQATSSANGYWLLASDGAIFSFGDAQYHGGANTIPHPAPIAAFAATSGSGYWIVASDGAIYSFGDAQYHGGANTTPHPAPIASIAGVNADGYWLSATDGAVYSFGAAAYHGGKNAL